MNQKPIYILGISESHTATAALLKDGRIVACASEERFSRIKLQPGTPRKSIEYCLNFAKIKPKDITLVAAADLEPPNIGPSDNLYTKTDLPLSFIFRLLLNIAEKIETIFPNSRIIFFSVYKLFKKLSQSSRQNKRISNLQKILPISSQKFIFFPHHVCHAGAALFASKVKDASLIFTADGVGDFESATASIFQNNKIEKLVSVDSQQSLGFFYQHITQYLGMRPVEDEYKVMGLAPYADAKKSQKVYERLKSFFKFDKSKNKWVIKISSYYLWRKLPRLLLYSRFDYIAYTAQKIIEEILSTWIKNVIEQTKVKNIALGGGVFANVKANLKIATTRGIDNIFFMPSPGDESNAIGVAYYAYFKLTKSIPKPLSNLYLGPLYNDDKIKKNLGGLSNILKIEKPKDINTQVAKLLASGEVVARFAGRMEFGARALGNRSILSRPDDLSVVSIINNAIKQRDFWMPFAPTILRDKAEDYLVLHKADSPFMNVAYDTTEKGQADLAAAIHPYDKTTRPQILDRSANPEYWDLVKKFEKLTGIGAILNTSFNLHGEPIVCTPEDALRTFRRSGLKYLQLESYLISKK